MNARSIPIAIAFFAAIVGAFSIPFDSIFVKQSFHDLRPFLQHPPPTSKTSQPDERGHKILGPVERVKFDPATFEEVWRRGKPVIFHSSMVDEWPARKKWNPDYFRQQTADNLLTVMNKRKFFMYFNDELPYHDMRLEFPSRKERVSIQELINRLENPPGEYLYYNGALDEDFPSLLADVEPGSDLLQVITTSSTNVSSLVSKMLWLGCEGVTAQTHYDASQNFYVQLFGTKEFLLSPPEEYSKLYLYPSLHPSYRQSQVDFQSPDTKKFPRFGDIQTWNATLRPGDMLYLPPFWFHRVTSKSLSISFNVWSDAESAVINDAEIERAPLPFEGKWTKGQKRLAVMLFLEMLIDAVEGPGASSRLLRDLAHERYAPLFPSVPQYLCGPSNSEEDKWSLDLPERFQKRIASTAEMFLRLSKDARALYLQNYAEIVVKQMLGIDQVAPFFLRCYS